MIRVNDLIHKYTIWESETKKTKKTVLDGISFDIPSGQFWAILGPNGSGKSTLAKHFNVLLLPDAGTVWINGKDTADVEQLWKIRDEVGMVFQNPDNQIIGTSVEEDVAFGPENRNVPSDEIRKRVEESLRAVAMLEKRKVSPSRLSGGQKQRVAIAGTIATNASCIVLDEPTAMLDPASRKEVLEFVHYLNRERGITILLITHHTEEVVDADHILLMDKGKIVKQGTPKDIFFDLELLRQMKMDAPQITVLGDFLQRQGLKLQTPVLHPEELISQIEVSDFTAKSLSPTDTPEKKENGEPLMKVTGISYTYGAGTVNEVRVLKDISFTIHKGECLGLMGASGSGKTTLIKHLNGLLKANEGDIQFEGKSIYNKKYKLTSLRKEVGLVFQYPEQQLFCRTVLADVCYGPLNLSMSKEEAEDSARKSLELVGIDESLYYASPLDLSGGQKRCVAIAGILAMKPKILVLDEPAAGLDPGTKHRIFDLLTKIKKELEIAVVLVSHHPEDVAEYADRMMVLNNGHLELIDTPQEVFSRSEYLQKIGMGIPQITTVTQALMKKGIPLPRPAITLQQAEDMFLQIMKCKEDRQ